MERTGTFDWPAFSNATFELKFSNRTGRFVYCSRTFWIILLISAPSSTGLSTVETLGVCLSFFSPPFKGIQLPVSEVRKDHLLLWNLRLLSSVDFYSSYFIDGGMYVTTYINSFALRSFFVFRLFEHFRFLQVFFVVINFPIDVLVFLNWFNLDQNIQSGYNITGRPRSCRHSSIIFWMLKTHEYLYRVDGKNQTGRYVRYPERE